MRMGEPGVVEAPHAARKLANDVERRSSSVKPPIQPQRRAKGDLPNLLVDRKTEETKGIEYSPISDYKSLTESVNIVIVLGPVVLAYVAHKISVSIFGYRLSLIDLSYSKGNKSG